MICINVIMKRRFYPLFIGRDLKELMNFIQLLFWPRWASLRLASQNELCQGLRCVDDCRNEGQETGLHQTTLFHQSISPPLEDAGFSPIPCHPVSFWYAGKAARHSYLFPLPPSLQQSLPSCSRSQPKAEGQVKNLPEDNFSSTITYKFKSCPRSPPCNHSMYSGFVGFVFSIKIPCVRGSGIFSFLKLRPFLWTLKIG